MRHPTIPEPCFTDGQDVWRHELDVAGLQLKVTKGQGTPVSETVLTERRGPKSSRVSYTADGN